MKCTCTKNICLYFVDKNCRPLKDSIAICLRKQPYLSINTRLRRRKLRPIYAYNLPKKSALERIKTRHLRDLSDRLHKKNALTVDFMNKYAYPRLVKTIKKRLIKTSYRPKKFLPIERKPQRLLSSVKYAHFFNFSAKKLYSDGAQIFYQVKNAPDRYKIIITTAINIIFFYNVRHNVYKIALF